MCVWDYSRAQSHQKLHFSCSFDVFLPFSRQQYVPRSRECEEKKANKVNDFDTYIARCSQMIVIKSLIQYTATWPVMFIQHSDTHVESAQLQRDCQTMRPKTNGQTRHYAAPISHVKAWYKQNTVEVQQRKTNSWSPPKLTCAKITHQKTWFLNTRPHPKR